MDSGTAQSIEQWLNDYEKEDEQMDMSKYKSDGNSADLKAKDFIGKNLKLVIERVDTVTYPANESQAEQTKAVLYFEGKDKRLVLNGTNTEILCNAYESYSEGWVGKEIGLSTADYTAKGFGHGWVVTPLDVAPPDFSDEIPFAFVLPTLLGVAAAAQEIATLV